VESPQSYGWILADGQGVISEARVKVAMPEPMKQHAVVGAFWFKKGRYFVEAAERMISRNGRINNEFYVDECVNDLIQLGKRVKVFEIGHYICWGTPNDYRRFLYWDKFFTNLQFHPYGK
jgi:hypothetical protein